MAVIKCKMCGGDLVIEPGSTVAECEYCGSKQTVPAADNEKKLNLFASANKLRLSCEFDRAAGVYDAIKAEFPSEAEAYWGLVLCKYGIEYVDDPATGKKVPTCHRLSFDSVMDDGNLEMAMDCADSVARKVYREEAKYLEQIRQGILQVSSNEKPYDIFICYKETDENGDRTLDSVLAQDLYSALAEKGYRVFFSRITLQSKLGEAYEPYIFAALNSAKVMLAIGTDPEYYSAVWVKNEWSRYLKICAGDNSKHLIPCYKDMDAYDMPREFRSLQGVDLGKMGAVQDILFNMEKYIPLKKQNTTVIQEKVVVGGTGGSNKIASLLDRGNMALEDGDWAKADSFFEDVLNNDARNAQAYIGKTLAQERCRTMDALVRKRRDVYQNVRTEELEIPERTAYISGMVNKFALPGYLEAGYLRTLYDVDRTYDSEVSGRKQQYQDEKNWWVNHKLLSRAEKFAASSVAETLQQEKKHLFAQLNDRIKQAEHADAKNIAEMEREYDAFLTETDAQAEKLHQDAISRREKDYQIWLEQAKTETEPKFLRDLADAFVSLYGYKDSKNLAEHCCKRAAEEQAKIEAENERQRVIAEQEHKAKQKKKKKLMAAAAVLTVIAIAVALIVMKVIVPANDYKAAEALMAKGKTTEAAMAFGALGDYKDAQERSFSLWGEITNRETISADTYMKSEIVAVRNDGTVATRGNGSRFHIDDWTDIEAVSLGGGHIVGLRNDGTVVASSNIMRDKSAHDFGACDVDDWDNIVAISAAYQQTIGLRSDGTVVATTFIPNDSNPYKGQCDVDDWTNIIAISAGDYHTVGLKADGTVVAVGSNSSGQCQVSDWSDIVAISAGAGKTVGLKSDGTVLTTKGISQWRDIVDISAGWCHIAGLKADGTVVVSTESIYDNSDYPSQHFDGWKDVVAISADHFATVGLRSDGTVVATGGFEPDYDYISDWTDIKIPVISEEKQAAMVAEKQEMEAQLAAEKKAEEERLAKEYAAAEKLAENGETAKAAIAFGKLDDYLDASERSKNLWAQVKNTNSIDVGANGHIVALKTNGAVVAVGNNEDGQCDTGAWKDIVSVSAGAGFTVGLKKNGTVIAIGYDDNDRFAVDDWQDIVAVSAGRGHTVGLKADGTVVVAGKETMNGKAIPLTGNWDNIIKVSAGYAFTVGLKSDGTVVSEGYNPDGQCDVEDWTDIVDISAGTYHTVGLKSDGTVVAVGYNQYGECDVRGWKDIVAVSAGKYLTVGLKADGTVVAIGWDEYGQCNTSDWNNIKLCK